MSDHSCSKCGGSMAGPTYGKNEYGMERLFYRCVTCGYRAEGPTDDQRQRANLPPWFPGQQLKDHR